MTNKKKRKSANIYLWHVTVDYEKYLGDRGSTTLRITTPSISIDRAIAKARAHVNKNKYDWPKARIEGAELQGQIAA